MPPHLLFPIDWPEPFGLVMIEAMACGTPVIAYRSGSVPEVVEDGVTGFIVENEEEAVAAVGRLGLSRQKDDPGALRGAFLRAAHGAGIRAAVSEVGRRARRRPTVTVNSKGRSQCRSG